MKQNSIDVMRSYIAETKAQQEILDWLREAEAGHGRAQKKPYKTSNGMAFFWLVFVSFSGSVP